MNRILALFLTLFIALVTGAAQARELADLNLDIVSAKRGNEAKQDAFDQATEEATRRLTEELIGADKFSKLWPSLRPKLLKSSTRYVMFIKGAAPQDTADGSLVQVQMRLSTDALEALLRELGASGGGTVRLLPLIILSEPKGTRYSWWTDQTDAKMAPSAAKELYAKLHQQMVTRFKAKNIFVLDPSSASFRGSVPANYRFENLRREDQQSLAHYLKSDVVLSGRVEAAPGSGLRLVYDLQLWQARSGRGVAEVQRVEPLVSDNAKVLAASMEAANGKVADELAAKLGEIVSAGALNLNVVRIEVTG
ncbi:MAG TPA: hypothetical protein PKC28_09115, partial [Bdellovibrionales bacterium]|nr:hypothetical protein [Bdellovibrionales bacterium]